MLSALNSAPTPIFLREICTLSCSNNNGYSKIHGFLLTQTAIALISGPDYSAPAGLTEAGVHFCGPSDMLSQNRAARTGRKEPSA